MSELTPLSPANVNSILVNIVNAYNKAERTNAEKEKRDACLLSHISSHILRHIACTRIYYTEKCRKCKGISIRK